MSDLVCPVSGVLGLDASWLQGVNDWPALYAQGYRFVILREGEAAYSEGDLTFRRNLEGAIAAGFVVGAYHPPHWDRPASEQVRWLRQRWPDFRAGIDIPPAIDAEWIKGLDPKTSHQCMVDFAKGVEDTFGVKPLVYTNGSFVVEAHYPDDSPLGELDLWLADYRPPSQITIPRPWAFRGVQVPKIWQWAGNAPPIRGMGGPTTTTDRNVYMGDLDALKSWVSSYGTNTQEVPRADSETAPLVESMRGQ